MLESVLTVVMSILSVLYISWIILALIPRKWNGKEIAPSVSVVIPAYNEARHIAGTIKSVLASNYSGNTEIIIVDDGSTDGTGKVAKSLSSKNVEVKIVKTDHVGKAKAVNAAIYHAKNAILIVLDADTRIEPDSIRKIVQPFARDKVAAVASTLRAYTTNNLLTWFQQFEYAISSGWRYVVDNVNGSCIVPGFCAFRKSMLTQVGGMKGDTAVEDYDICMYLKKAGYEIAMVPSSVAYTKVPETLVGWVKQRIRWTRGTLQVMRKHRDVILNRKFAAVGLYSIPTQMYWFFHALIYLPLVIYQIFSGYFQWFVSKGMALSPDAAIYFVKWLTVAGMADFIYNISVGSYPLTFLNFLTILVFFLSFGFGVYSMMKFSKLTPHSLFALIFFFPYTLVVLAVYVAATVYQLTERDRGERWDKVN